MDRNLILFLAAFGLVLVVRQLRRAKANAKKPKQFYHRRIEGYQVEGLIHPRMADGCLLDNGLQYGKGFRRKEGPLLPHGPHCGCQTRYFNFNSTEVFNGALRSHSQNAGSCPSLPPQAAHLLVERLKGLLGQPTPAKLAAYEAAVGLENWPEEERAAVGQFLKERHAYLMESPRQSKGAESGAKTLARQAEKPAQKKGAAPQKSPAKKKPAEKGPAGGGKTKADQTKTRIAGSNKRRGAAKPPAAGVKP